MRNAKPLKHPFHLGQRVRMTAKAYRNGLHTRQYADRGVVVGLGSPAHNLSVVVQRDLLKRPTSYHVSFWEPDPPVLTPRREQEATK